MKKFKYVVASILFALCCAIVIGAPKVALAAGDNQVTVNVTDTALPATGDNALTLPLIVGVAGATVVVAGAALFLHKKRQ